MHFLKSVQAIVLKNNKHQSKSLKLVISSGEHPENLCEVGSFLRFVLPTLRHHRVNGFRAVGWRAHPVAHVHLVGREMERVGVGELGIRDSLSLSL